MKKRNMKKRNMKKRNLFYLSAIVLLMNAAQVFSQTPTKSNAQSKVEKIDLMGKTYTVTNNFPEEIMGVYKYEGKGAPIVKLEKNGEGLFQPHMVDPIKIKFWIDCDENGIIRKQEGSEGRYQYTLLIQYLDGENGNYPAGEYDLMGVTILKDLGRAVIYGERYKPLD